MTRFRSLALLTAATALLLAGCSTGTDAVSKGGDFQFVSPNGQTKIYYDPPGNRRPPGEFAGPDLVKANAEVKLADYPAEVVLLNVWGSWCGPCRAEVDELELMYQQYRPRGVQFLGVDVQDGDQKSAADFAQDHRLTYPSIYDFSGRTLLAFRGIPKSVTPTTIVLDRRHRVAAVFLGPINDAEVRPLIDRLAAEH